MEFYDGQRRPYRILNSRMWKGSIFKIDQPTVLTSILLKINGMNSRLRSQRIIVNNIGRNIFLPPRMFGMPYLKLGRSKLLESISRRCKVIIENKGYSL